MKNIWYVFPKGGMVGVSYSWLLICASPLHRANAFSVFLHLQSFHIFFVFSFATCSYFHCFLALVFLSFSSFHVVQFTLFYLVLVLTFHLLPGWWPDCHHFTVFTFSLFSLLTFSPCPPFHLVTFSPRHLITIFTFSPFSPFHLFTVFTFPPFHLFPFSGMITWALKRVY